jgi:hypothetical protein
VEDSLERPRMVRRATRLMLIDEVCSGSMLSPLLWLLVALLWSISALGSDAQSGAQTRARLQWQAPHDHASNSLGSVVALGSNGVRTLILSPEIIADGGVLEVVGSQWSSNRQQLQVTYRRSDELIVVSISLQLNEAGLRADISALDKSVKELRVGAWVPECRPQTISVPYYDGPVSWLRQIGVFADVRWDWHTSHATTLDGNVATYSPRSDGRRNAVSETLEVITNPDIDKIFPVIANPPSPYREQMAGRIVLDVWSEPFDQIAAELDLLRRAGIRRCAVVVHDWQRFGYDNALPDHTPANRDLGGDGGMRRLSTAAARSGCLMALHENYVDYYPNVPGFDRSAIALNADGSLQKATLNLTTGLQAYATKRTRMLAYAQEQAAIISEAYKPTAAFIDVNSAVPPWWRADMDSTIVDAGRFTPFALNSVRLWHLERIAHSGPVLGEGKAHWFWSGLLDGVEAQTGEGHVQDRMGEKLPLFVDFDLLRIHPLQVNHGMGYFERWTPTATCVRTPEESDAYRMQEVAFGHSPFLGCGEWNDPYRAMVESGLIGPVSQRYGISRPVVIAYRLKGKWVEPSDAARAQVFSQVRVTYRNGLDVVVNGSSEPLNWRGRSLPIFGWYAKGAGVEAYTAYCGITICDFAQTANSLYANPRIGGDAQTPIGGAVVQLSDFKSSGDRTFTFQLHWKPLDELRRAGTQVFVHFVLEDDALKPNSPLAFQADYTPSPGGATSSGPFVETLQQRIPDGLPDGVYSIRVGLYNSLSGRRVRLAGADDGALRYGVGRIRIANGGRLIEQQREPTPLCNPRLRCSHEMVDFGAIRTDGMVWLQRTRDVWSLTASSWNRPVTIQLPTGTFPLPRLISTERGGILHPTVRSDGWWELVIDSFAPIHWRASRAHTAATRTTNSTTKRLLSQVKGTLATRRYITVPNLR